MLQGRGVSVIGWFLLAAPSRASSSCSAPSLLGSCVVGGCAMGRMDQGWTPTFLPQSRPRVHRDEVSGFVGSNIK